MTAPERVSQSEAMEILLRGVSNIHHAEDLATKQAHFLKTGTPLRIKAGFDPTAPDLHLGHFVLLKKLREFQDLGHQVLFLIGDFTAMIGDPTGRSELRKPLTREQILENSKTYTNQVFRVLDPARTEVLYNSSWMSEIGVEGMIRLAAKETVARFLERDDFSQRMTKGLPIFLHELLYPLIQGYDSVAMRADVELGGTDQLFNLLVGRDLMRNHEMSPQVVMTMPLLVGLDGERKMSKSLKNAIGLLDGPDEMFGKVMSIPDSLMADWMTLLTDLPLSLLSGHPRDAKMALASAIVGRFHGRETADLSRENFIRTFSRRETPLEMPEFFLEEPFPLKLSTIMVKVGAAPSESKAKQLIQQKSVDIDGTTVVDPFHVMQSAGFQMRVGKRFHCRVLKS
ncbi:MAG: tyrosine--tRNA ligase [Nitrospiraceae bacterium]|jgi:tyrosyl-tRNA synthetase|nr:tyrosine--tRNA ligase [Nitrospiraceae bacterium]